MKISTSNRISNYFKMQEAVKTDTGLPNVPDNAETTRIIYTAYRMDLVRMLLGVPVIVNSWFRSKEVNTAVGGASLSMHRQGMAIDFRTKELSPKQIVEKIKASGISYDQLIIYDTFVHIGFTFVDNERKQFIDKRRG